MSFSLIKKKVFRDFYMPGHAKSMPNTKNLLSRQNSTQTFWLRYLSKGSVSSNRQDYNGWHGGEVFEHPWISLVPNFPRGKEKQRGKAFTAAAMHSGDRSPPFLNRSHERSIARCQNHQTYPIFEPSPNAYGVPTLKHDVCRRVGDLLVASSAGLQGLV